MRLFPLIASFCLSASQGLSDPTFWVHEWPNTDFETTSVTS